MVVQSLSNELGTVNGTVLQFCAMLFTAAPLLRLRSASASFKRWCIRSIVVTIAASDSTT